MPFQAIAYAERIATGDPLSKLLWIKLVGDSQIDGYADIYVDALASFAGSAESEVRAALNRLQALGLIYWPETDFRFPGDWACCICKLPLSKEDHSARKRPKLTQDQLVKIDTSRCPGCLRFQAYGDGSDEEPGSFFVGEFHVDHIIPRSVGGADVEENLQLLCPRCNSRKHNRAGWVDFLA